MGTFKGVRNDKGRPKGALGKTSAEARKAMQAIVNNELDKIPELLDQLTPNERVQAIIKMANFVIPKITELTVDSENKEGFEPLTITLIN